MAEALDKLQAEDARVAGDAEAAFGSLNGVRAWRRLPLHGLPRFLWYELPRKWITDLDGNRHIATALGRLPELVGLAVTPTPTLAA